MKDVSKMVCLQIGPISPIYKPSNELLMSLTAILGCLGSASSFYDFLSWVIELTITFLTESWDIKFPTISANL